MNAHKFVAQKGIDEAKRVFDGAHWENIAYSNGHYYSQSCSENDVNLEELKQVVDSIDYLNEWYEGKIDGAYDHVERMHGMLKLKPQFPNLHSRIKLVERHLANYELVKANKNGEA
ncbi:hypothetical protein [Acinetobacter soli]|uniref:hypothetical protein n=1 Tax=Acinetobacter soli TaxID=487316 RepID=UPI0004697CF7|nr:hypothetical protein [Acinetobacter soli]